MSDGQQVTGIDIIGGPHFVAAQPTVTGGAAAGSTAHGTRRPADLGKAVTVRVTGSRTGFASTSKTSAATVAVAAAASTSTPTPTLSGTAKVDYRLTAVPSSWSGRPYWYDTNCGVGCTCAMVCSGVSIGASSSVKFFQPSHTRSGRSRLSADQVPCFAFWPPCPSA